MKVYMQFIDHNGFIHFATTKSKASAVKSLAVLEIPPTAKDVTEWLEQGHTQEDLLSLGTITLNEYKNTYFNNTAPKQDLASKRDNFGTTSGQDWGIYAKKFDEFMRESAGRVDKREGTEIRWTSPCEVIVSQQYLKV